eukprot:9296886-Pyramimonas_sp.AAC.1
MYMNFAPPHTLATQSQRFLPRVVMLTSYPHHPRGQVVARGSVARSALRRYACAQLVPASKCKVTLWSFTLLNQRVATKSRVGRHVRGKLVKLRNGSVAKAADSESSSADINSTQRIYVNYKRSQSIPSFGGTTSIDKYLRSETTIAKVFKRYSSCE